MQTLRTVRKDLEADEAARLRGRLNLWRDLTVIPVAKFCSREKNKIFAVRTPKSGVDRSLAGDLTRRCTSAAFLRNVCEA